MNTVRQIERLWNNRHFDRLLRELTATRPESSLRLQNHLAGPVAAAAMAIIWLDEVSQPHVPLYSRLIRTILAAQDADGGWTEPMLTALCLRALLCGRGNGIAVNRGMNYLATLQKSEGIWPRAPLRRMTEDPFVSAYILYQLGQNEAFRQAVGFTDAVQWFDRRQADLDAESRRLWDRAAARCRRLVQPVMPWS